MPTEPLVFVAESWMYEEGEIEHFYDDLSVPYRVSTTADLSRVWAEASAATHVVVARARVTESVLASLPRLKAVVKFGRGVERIDVQAASKRGVVVAYTPYAVQGVAEAALLFMLALSKRLPRKLEAARLGERADDLPIGSELAGKTLGVIGFGAIGQSLARMASGIGMRVLIHSPAPDPAKVADCNGQIVSLEDLLAHADYVSLHASATRGGRPILGDEQIAMMKPHAFFVNTARGSLVDEQALIAALRSGGLAGAGLDAVADEPIKPNSPLLHMDNVIVTPHALGMTRESFWRIKEAVREALRVLLAGGLPQFVANREAARSIG